MSKPDAIYEIHDDEDTSYRVAPNPDAPPGTGFESGAMLQFKDHGEKEWRDHFHVAPDALDGVAQALAAAAKDVKA